MDFKAKYNRTNFTEFFRDKLLPEDFQLHTESIVPDFKSNYFKEITFLGKSRSLDLNVYEIRHTSEKDARVGLSRDAFKLVSRFSENNALFLFVPDNPANFRLSLVTIDPKLDDHGVKVLKEYSNPRRYSFVLGEDAKTHTPEQYLIGQGRISDIADLKKRFSVEVVNKEFYNQIAELFSRLVGGKRKMGNRLESYMHEMELPSIPLEGHEQKYKEFAVRLIGRTVFCWFLKKKKSSNDIPLIPDDVLSKKVVDSSSNFYHSIIEPLFFQILNTPLSERKKEFRNTVYDTIPFLNGGLFEPQADDYFTNNMPNYALKIPDDWFKYFIEVLDTYNFTIDENTSIDIDLSVDPEMLGRIFENLLAEINPETGETARKATGSFYTPRSIVDYMVNESLKQYLITKTNIEENKLDALLDYSIEESGLNNSEEKKVIKAFDTIKILDPACGSGAFPMGMLQKMLLVLQKVDHEAKNSIQKILNEIPDPIKRKLVEAKLKAANVSDDDDLDDYARKLSLIQRSIYGIDIQPIASDISKLRFFLSLIVDEVVQDDKINRGIEPLPNLEFKFVCANTLVPLPNQDVQKNLFEDIENIEKLEKIREDYFISYGEEKEKLKRDFKSVQAKMYQHHLSTIQAYASNKDSQTAKLIDWNPFKNNVTNWFDSKWMFGEEKGFDIIIGNPPYIAFQRMDINSKNLVQNLKYRTFENTGDVYSIFYERGKQLLKEKGVLCYITSRQWMHSSYGKSLREFFVTETDPIHLIDFGQIRIFEGATVFVNILLLKNQKNSNSLIACLLPSDYSVENTNLSSRFKTCGNVLSNLSSNTWIVNDSNKLNEQIEKIGTPLSNWKELDFYRGITSGLNEAFHIDESIKNELINANVKNKDVIKPLLRGKDIKRYNYTYADLYTLFIPWHFPLHEDKTISNSSVVAEKAFKKEYPAIYSHLEQFKTELSNRNKAETGVRYEWYALQRYGADFWENYEKPKIVWIEISDRANYAYDENGMYLTNSAYFLTCKNDSVSLKYLLAVLNSKVADFYFSQKTAKIAGGRMRYTKQYVEQIPIPKISLPEQQPFIFLVDCVLFLKGQEKLDNSISKMTYYFENVIEVAVAELYFKDETNKIGYNILTDLKKVIKPISEINLRNLSVLFETFNNSQNSIGLAVNTLKNHEPFKTIESALTYVSK